MKVQDIMTKNPQCCTPQTPLQEVAQMMVEHDCGAIPVVESDQSMKLLGMITDRDIVCRTIAEGKNPLELTAEHCMSKPAVSVTPETSIQECTRLMENNQIRRIPVVDENGACVGIVTQAHIAQHLGAKKSAEVLKSVSQKTPEPSRVGAH